MIEIISKLPLFVQIYVYIGTPIIILILVFIASKSGLNFTGGKSGFSLSFTKKKKEDSPHKNCDHKYDAIESMRTIRKIEREIIELKYMVSIKKQMNIAEGCTKSAIGKLLKIYTSLLSDIGFEDPIKTDSCQSYLLILKILESRIIDKMRVYIRENHFAEKTEVEFSKYIESKISDIKLSVTETLNDLYYYRKDISRATLYEANDKKMQEFEHIVTNCFQDCRVIAIETMDRIKYLELHSNKIFDRFLS